MTLLVALGSLGLWLWTRERGATAPPPVAVHTQVTFAGDVRAAALSPDGRTVAFATGPHGGPIRIMARDLAGGQAIELWRGGDVYKLQWLPDASSLLASGMDCLSDSEACGSFPGSEEPHGGCPNTIAPSHDLPTDRKSR